METNKSGQQINSDYVLSTVVTGYIVKAGYRAYLKMDLPSWAREKQPLQVLLRVLENQEGQFLKYCSGIFITCSLLHVEVVLVVKTERQE